MSGTRRRLPALGNGRINVFVGNTSSESQNKQSFTVTGGRPAKVSRRGGRR